MCRSLQPGMEPCSNMQIKYNNCTSSDNFTFVCEENLNKFIKTQQQQQQIYQLRIVTLSHTLTFCGLLCSSGRVSYSATMAKLTQNENTDYIIYIFTSGQTAEVGLGVFHLSIWFFGTANNWLLKQYQRLYFTCQRLVLAVFALNFFFLLIFPDGNHSTR